MNIAQLCRHPKEDQCFAHDFIEFICQQHSFDRSQTFFRVIRAFTELKRVDRPRFRSPQFRLAEDANDGHNGDRDSTNV